MFQLNELDDIRFFLNVTLGNFSQILILNYPKSKYAFLIEFV